MEENKEVGYGKFVIIKTDDSSIGGAILEIQKDKQTDMQFHRLEGKIVYVMIGKIKATVIKDGRVANIDVGAGNSFYIKPGLVHQLTAVGSTAVVIEFGCVDLYDDINCVFKGSQVEKPTELKKKESEVDTSSEPIKEAILAQEPEKKVTEKRQTRKKKAQKGKR